MDNWRAIDDNKAKEMLKEIYENLENDDLLDYHSNALEKRYRKPTGTISDFIFFKEYSIDEIIKRLNLDDVTYL